MIVLQCSSTVSKLAPFQVSFFVDVGRKLFLQSGSDRNLQSCSTGPSRILLRHGSSLEQSTVHCTHSLISKLDKRLKGLASLSVYKSFL